MKLMLIDGHSLTYRAFYALPTDLATASGQVTNAVYGFTSMLLNLVRDHRPDALAVAFDRPEPTFRHERVPTYKAQREAAPDILRQQLGLVRQVVEVLTIPVVEKPGIEADDLIATLAERARVAGDDVIIVTGDRDSYQLVSDPHVRVLYNRRGVSDYVLYDEAGIKARTGVTPAQYVTYAALRGDPSDNLPGVPKVGEKTAAKLVNAYGDLDGIFSHVDEQTPKLRESLIEFEDQARSNAEVMALLRDVDLEVDPRELQVGEIDTDEVRRLFDFLEFQSLHARLAEAFGDELAASVGGVDTVAIANDQVTDLAETIRRIAALTEGQNPVALACSWREALDHFTAARPHSLALAPLGEPASAWWIDDALLEVPDVLDALAELAQFAGPGVVIHDAKPLVRWMIDQGRSLNWVHTDTRLAAYLLDPADTNYRLPDLLLRFAQVRLEGHDVSDSSQGQLAFVDDTPVGPPQSTADVTAVSLLARPLRSAMEEQGLVNLHDDMEVPLVRILAKMESVGIGVDRDRLNDIGKRLLDESNTYRSAIHAAAGHEFNVNSTPQLRQVLFDELGLTPQKKTKTGYSTDAASLEKMRDEHDIVDNLLHYREVEKLRTTYADGLLAEVAPDGRIHATFNQTVARTGRLSSDRPNLHNIPVRSVEGKAFREVFIAGPGLEFLVADYNQIELRCIAHLSGDSGLIEAFRSGRDIHSEVAARTFGVSGDEVTSEQRSKAKMVSYGLAYGMEAFGLAQRLSVSRSEAQGILDAYFAAFSTVRAYMDATVAEARERGYTETLFGRRRQIPELADGNRQVRMAGERQAMNAGIQGLAADLFKVALVRLDAALTEEAPDSQVILQVHDEVILEIPLGQRDLLATLTRRVMEGVYELDVPLTVDLAFGSTWAAAKG